MYTCVDSLWSHVMSPQFDNFKDYTKDLKFISGFLSLHSMDLLFAICEANLNKQDQNHGIWDDQCRTALLAGGRWHRPSRDEERRAGRLNKRRTRRDEDNMEWDVPPKHWLLIPQGGVGGLISSRSTWAFLSFEHQRQPIACTADSRPRGKPRGWGTWWRVTFPISCREHKCGNEIQRDIMMQ